MREHRSWIFSHRTRDRRGGHIPGEIKADFGKHVGSYVWTMAGKRFAKGQHSKRLRRLGLMELNLGLEDHQDMLEDVNDDPYYGDDDDYLDFLALEEEPEEEPYYPEYDPEPDYDYWYDDHFI